MYTVTIQGTHINDSGNAYASILFSRDTGEMEQYRDLITLEDGTQEYTEIIERPKIDLIYKNINFTTQEDLELKINQEKTRLDSLLISVTSIPVGEFEVTPVINIQPTTEEITAAAEADAKRLWLRKKAALKEMISDMQDMQALGVTVTPEKLTVIQTLASWCDTNVKEEYYL